MDDLDPVAQLEMWIQRVASIDALLDIAAARGVDMPGASALLASTLQLCDRLAADLARPQDGGPEAGEA